jgi:hypothetical protein
MLELGQEIDDRRHAQERRKKITSMIAKPSQLSCCVPTLSRLISFRADFIATCLVSCQLHPLSRFVPTSSVVSFRANFIRCLVSCQLHPLSRSVPTSSLVSFRANFIPCLVPCQLQVHGTLCRFVPTSSSWNFVSFRAEFIFLENRPYLCRRRLRILSRFVQKTSRSLEQRFLQSRHSGTAAP